MSEYVSFLKVEYVCNWLQVDLQNTGIRPGTCRKTVPTSRVAHPALQIRTRAKPVETHQVAPFKLRPFRKGGKKNLKWVHWDQNGPFKNEFAAVSN